MEWLVMHQDELAAGAGPSHSSSTAGTIEQDQVAQKLQSAMQQEAGGEDMVRPACMQWLNMHLLEGTRALANQ